MKYQFAFEQLNVRFLACCVVADKTTTNALSVGKDGWMVVLEWIRRDSHTLSLMPCGFQKDQLPWRQDVQIYT